MEVNVYVCCDPEGILHVYMRVKADSMGPQLPSCPPSHVIDFRAEHCSEHTVPIGAEVPHILFSSML